MFDYRWNLFIYKGHQMNKIIVFGSVAVLIMYNRGHVSHESEIMMPHEDEYREVYPRLTPELQQMATGSIGYDKPAQGTYHLS